MELTFTAFRHRDLWGVDPKLILLGIFPIEPAESSTIQGVDPPTFIDKNWNESMHSYLLCADDIRKTNNIILSESIGRVIREGDLPNDYGVSDTEGTIMMTLSPASAQAITETYALSYACLWHTDTHIPVDYVYGYLDVWVRLLDWSARGDYGIFFHCT
jgi:hypothetical protein